MARTESDVAGFVLGHREIQSDAVLFYVKEMCVALEHQGRGVGKQILAGLERELRAQGVNGIYLVTARASPAEALYKRVGFGIDEQTVIMGKTLS